MFLIRISCSSWIVHLGEGFAGGIPKPLVRGDYLPKTQCTMTVSFDSWRNKNHYNGSSKEPLLSERNHSRHIRKGVRSLMLQPCNIKSFFVWTPLGVRTFPLIPTRRMFTNLLPLLQKTHQWRLKHVTAWFKHRFTFIIHT